MPRKDVPREDFPFRRTLHCERWLEILCGEDAFGDGTVLGIPVLRFKRRTLRPPSGPRRETPSGLRRFHGRRRKRRRRRRPRGFRLLR